MDNSKKLVLQLAIHDDKGKQKALKAVSGISGIESLAMDMKDKKLTVIGVIDPTVIVNKLRKKLYHADILTVGPAKEQEKKKEEPKKEEGKKDDAKKKEDDEKKRFQDFVNACKNYNPYMTQCYCVHCVENPNGGCVIC